MKITVAGDTPMERLTNFTKKIVAVPKQEVTQLERKWRAARKRKQKKR